MRRLDQSGWDRSRRFLMTQARALERTLFEHRFENGNPATVLAALDVYRNEDGGFGHGLEPDVRTPTSSALATALGLQILHELKTSPDHPMVRDAVGYLISSLDRETLVWRVVPLDANRYPHAPWWHDDGSSLGDTFDGFRIVPRALIVALLHHHREIVPPELLSSLTEDTLSAIQRVRVLGQGGGSDLEYAQALAKIQDLPQRDTLVSRVRDAVEQAVVRDPEAWTTYCITPLRAVSSPDAIGADRVTGILERHLSFVIESQTAEGTWDPTWSWFGQYPESWKAAKQAWRGILTLEILTSLRAFGRA